MLITTWRKIVLAEMKRPAVCWTVQSCTEMSCRREKTLQILIGIGLKQQVLATKRYKKAL